MIIGALYDISSPGWYDKDENLYALGRYEEAIQDYDRVIEMDPLSPDVWNGKVDAFSKLERDKEARSQNTLLIIIFNYALKIMIQLNTLIIVL